MKSTNGMNSQSTKKLLTPQDVCAIIKQCGESKVSEMQFGDLFISFKANEIAEKPQGPVVINEQNYKPISNDSEVELIQKEEELANLLLDDPSAYEDGLANGDFVDLGEKKDAEA